MSKFLTGTGPDLIIFGRNPIAILKKLPDWPDRPVLRKAQKYIQSVTWYQAFIVCKNPASKFKKYILFLDLTKSG